METNDNICRLCGKPINADHYIPEFAEKMKERKLCFSCNLWTEHHELDKNRKFAVIDGKHYVISNSGLKGMCGTTFTIRFFDGETVTTDNLWHQGTIPEHLRHLFPDNAEFIQ